MTSGENRAMSSAEYYSLEFKGRGFVQITGRKNYQLYTNLLGIDFVGHHDLAADPANSVTITVDGMVNGRFTGVGLSNHINDKKTDFTNASQS